MNVEIKDQDRTLTMTAGELDEIAQKFFNALKPAMVANVVTMEDFRQILHKLYLRGRSDVLCEVANALLRAAQDDRGIEILRNLNVGIAEDPRR